MIWAAIVAGTATVLLVIAVAGRALTDLRADLRAALIAEAKDDESASDLGMWEHELTAPGVADLE